MEACGRSAYALVTTWKYTCLSCTGVSSLWDTIPRNQPIIYICKIPEAKDQKAFISWWNRSLAVNKSSIRVNNITTYGPFTLFFRLLMLVSMWYYIPRLLVNVWGACECFVPLLTSSTHMNVLNGTKSDGSTWLAPYLIIFWVYYSG